MANLDPALLTGRIGRQAKSNLYLFISLYGNCQFLNTTIAATEIADLMDNPDARRALAIAAEHSPLVERLPGPMLYGDTESIIDYQTRMPSRLVALPHRSPA